MFMIIIKVMFFISIGMLWLAYYEDRKEREKSEA